MADNYDRLLSLIKTQIEERHDSALRRVGTARRGVASGRPAPQSVAGSGSARTHGRTDMISYKNVSTRSDMESDDSLDLIDESKLKIVFTHPEQDPTVSAI